MQRDLKIRSFVSASVGICVFLAGAGPSPGSPSGREKGSSGATSSASSAYDSREIWKGTFEQTAPMPWRGPIELYLRYNSEAPPPQRVDGILTWQTLGNAKIRVDGERTTEGVISFSETSCVAGDCSQVVLGGHHQLTVDKARNELKGSAEGAFGLKGNYRLSQ